MLIKCCLFDIRFMLTILSKTPKIFPVEDSTDNVENNLRFFLAL
jgi:hypothetical protein